MFLLKKLPEPIFTPPTSIMAIAPPLIEVQFSNIESVMLKLFEGLLLLVVSLRVRAPPRESERLKRFKKVVLAI